MIIYSKSTGQNPAAIDNLETPIKMIIEHESQLLTKAGGVAEKLFNITIQPEKEIVMILVAHDIRDAVLKSLYDAVGVNTEAQGIAFTLPVDNVVGVGKRKPAPKTEGDEKTEKSEKKDTKQEQ